MDQILDPGRIQIKAFRRKPQVSVEGESPSIVPDLLLLPQPAVQGQTQPAAVTEEAPQGPLHPLTASTGTILAVNLDLVASELHLQSSLLRGLAYFAQGAGKTKAALTEVLYQLANTGNISEALRQFLVTKQTSEFALLRISDDAETVALFEEITRSLHSDANVEEFSLKELDQRLKEDAEKREKLKKMFKLTVIESTVDAIEDSIITKLALKDFMN